MPIRPTATRRRTATRPMATAIHRRATMAAVRRRRAMGHRPPATAMDRRRRGMGRHHMRGRHMGTHHQERVDMAWYWIWWWSFLDEVGAKGQGILRDW